MLPPSPFSESGSVKTINIYPIKSLRGTSVEQAEVLPSGGLRYDRQYAFFDLEKDLWIRAKAYPQLIRIDSQFSLEEQQVSLHVDGGTHVFDLAGLEGRTAISAWMSDFLKLKVELREDRKAGFFDDLKRNRYGISLLSTASLKHAMEWFPDLSADELKRRMRMNVEIDRVQPFWEEGIINGERTSSLQIGSVRFLDPWPCSRCSVPARDSISAESNPEFVKELTAFRQSDSGTNAYLKKVSQLDRFDGFFTFGVRLNGCDLTSGRHIALGDKVSASPGG